MKCKTAPEGKPIFEDEHGWYYTNYELSFVDRPELGICDLDWVDVKYYVKRKRRPRHRPDPAKQAVYDLF